ncbi:sigma-54-dependent transcriptional regulator [Azospira restricta]|uniref:Sigma-54-dependent Fis family transcriptional regulator n=1 Tax=Azospira restricta TaxID=404405 RepID=A0A974SLT3_9RHOO|nr:sigma-54 dependent transcriptional regulator [Azospira restricta]QRJ62486.1 sigma-54-dependent Fis family transcriptional regulator [Azospira restricta]
MPTILIIDDEASLVSSLTFALEAEGYKVHGAGTGAEGLAAVAALHPDLVLLDLRLPDRSGLEVLEALPRGENDNSSAPQVIMISAHGDTRAAVKAVKMGAADYLTKPFDLDELLAIIESALERRRMACEIDFHRRAALRDSGLVGQSPALLELAATIGRVARSGTARILILGESGTGKALVAKAIHTGSPRAAGPFIEINCASLPEQLIEAELFGAEKGAYTGAHARRAGLVALADKGTLFLDEIGELPLPLQAKLLHFLENGQYRAIGSSASQTADVRVVAATNRDLAKEAAAGRFREDLYYRLNVISLAVPPLRERGDDIGELADHFARRYAHEEGVAPIRLGAVARGLLAAYRWPGNVRELKNLIERLTILFPGREIGAAELPPEIAKVPQTASPAAAAPAVPAAPAAPAAAPREAASISDALADAERDMLLAALREHAGHKGKAADSLGISRHAFKRRLQRLGIQ